MCVLLLTGGGGRGAGGEDAREINFLVITFLFETVAGHATLETDSADSFGCLHC